jgi:glycerate dehydrogenase
MLSQRVAEIGKALGMQAIFAAPKGKSGLGALYAPWEEALETRTSSPCIPPSCRRRAT